MIKRAKPPMFRPEHERTRTVFSVSLSRADAEFVRSRMKSEGIGASEFFQRQLHQWAGVERLIAMLKELKPGGVK